MDELPSIDFHSTIRASCEVRVWWSRESDLAEVGSRMFLVGGWRHLVWHISVDGFGIRLVIGNVHGNGIVGLRGIMGGVTVRV